MEKKICNIVRDVLPLYIDEVVCADTSEWIEAHLAECPECARIAGDMRAQPVIPANADVHTRSMDGMRKFKQLINKRWLKITAITAISVVVAMIALMCWLMLTVEVIEYDGNNIEIREVEQGYGLVLCYNGRGDVLWGAGTVPATGETTIVVTQRLWDKYIDPIYDGSTGQYYLMESDRTLVIREQETGEILWEADEDQAARFYERQAKMMEEHPDYYEHPIGE